MYYSEVYDAAYSPFDGIKCLKIMSDSNQRTLHDVTFPDRGGGFGYRSPVDHCIEATRMIIWRCHNDTLDLQEFSLQTDLSGSQLRIAFTGSSVVDCKVFHIDCHIYLLICTSTGVATVQFSLSNISTMSTLNSSQTSIFSDTDSIWHKFYAVKGLQPSTIRTAKSHLYVNPHCAVFAFGLSNGTLLIARLTATSSDHLEVFELTQSSIIRKLWSGLTPFSRNDSDSTESIIDLVFLPLADGEQVVASICKDHRLRLWDLKHRGCFAVVDLLDSVSCLPSVAEILMSGNTATTGMNSHQHYAPGMCHKIACLTDKVASHSSVEAFKQLLIYLSLTPSTCGGANGIPVLDVDQQPFNCWVWVSLDLVKAKRWGRDCLQVDCVEPLSDVHIGFPASTEVGKSDSMSEPPGIRGRNVEVSAIDFIPFQMANFHVCCGCTTDTSEMNTEVGESVTSASYLGIWWLAHQTSAIDTGLDSLYSVQWTSALHSPEGSTTLPRSVIAVPPNLVPHMPYTRHRCVPSMLMEQPMPASVGADSFAAVSGDSLIEKLEEFLDFIFYPGRLSGIAIASALKSLRKSYNLCRLQVAATAEELRQQLFRTLSDELHAYLETEDGHSLLKTFYFTALDMHDYGLQPLGMFCCQWKTGTLSLADGGRIPFTPGLVIVRRWGFSVLRPLENFERLLWSHPITRSLASPHDGAISSTTGDTTSQGSVNGVLELSKRTCILLHHLCHHQLWPLWEADLFALSNSSHSTNPIHIAKQILNIFDETDSIYAPSPIVDVNNWRQSVFHVPLHSDHLVSFDQLIALLDSSDFCDSNSIIGELENLKDNRNSVSSCGVTTRMSCTIIELFGQAFRNVNEARMHFAFGLLVLLMRYQVDWIGPVPALSFNHNLFPMHLVTRLHDLVCRLRVLNWIACTKMPILPDPRRLMNIWEHLNRLGMRQSVTTFDDNSLDVGRLPDLFQSHLPGLTLLEQMCLDWLPTNFWVCDKPWVLRFSRLVGQLHAHLSPSAGYGPGHQLGLLRVVRHLLLAGRSTELIQLTELLAASDVFNHPNDDPGDTHYDDDFQSLPVWSWDGDYSMIGLCAGLAKLWSGDSKSAETYFKEASNWLFEYTVQITTTVNNRITSLSSVDSGGPQRLLVNVLFPGEFSFRKLLNVSDETELMTHAVCPGEAQVRFLMKLMPVLEDMDCISELLNLAEYALIRLAQLRLLPPFALVVETRNSEVDAVIKEGASPPSTCLISSGKPSRNSMKHSSEAGFLCGSALREDSPERLTLLTRLGELEATLWTRLFKHELGLGNYTRAHMLIHSNPDAARRRDCLRQLVVALCDRGEASLLVTFQYGSLENEILSILEARARATDVLPSASCNSVAADRSDESINPYYDILYAYHVRRSNYRAAAVVMFEHAHRLAVEPNHCSAQSVPGSPVGSMMGGARILWALQRQATCLVTAINALHLVPADHQWLIRPGSVAEEDNIDNLNPHQDNKIAFLHELTVGDWAFDEAVDDEKPNTLQPQSPLVTCNQVDREGKVILSLDDLVRSYTLTRASLRLTKVCWERGMLRAGPQSPQDTVEQLLTLAIYDEAVRVCEAFRLDCSPIISAVACRFADLAYFEATSNCKIFRQSAASGDSTPAHLIPKTDAMATHQPPCLLALTEVSTRHNGKFGDNLTYEADQVLHAIRGLSVTKSSRQYRVDTSVRSTTRWHRDLCTLYSDLLQCILTRFEQPGSHVASTCRSLYLLAAQCLLLSNRYTPSSRSSEAGGVPFSDAVIPRLPSWLAVSLMREQPAALLRVYLQANCLEAGHHLAMDILQAASGKQADSTTFGFQTSLKGSESSTVRLGSGDLQKMTTVPMWLPHNLLARLLEALRQLSNESPACMLLHESLSKSMAAYFMQLECVCRRTFA